MTAASHTPGPWEVAASQDNPNVVFARPNYNVALCPDHWGDGTAPANARLIAAAPELAEALRRAVEEFDSYGEVWQSDDDDEYGPATAIEKARAALQKAGLLD